jgi:tetratricopeptide (TPR) repeat protein
LGNYKSALEYYKRAELYDTNRLWSLKKIIFCYRKLGDNDAALKWSLEATALDPEDAYLQTMLGNCYLDLQQYETALDHYFKAEILSPENKKVLRPIAWCCFVLGKLDLALNYFHLLLNEEPTANDFINVGHVELCLGNKPKAMEYYIAAIASGGTSLIQLSETLDFDKHHLLANGVDKAEIQLITDYIRYKG